MTTLPAQPTALIGREREIAAVRDLLRRADAVSRTLGDRQNSALALARLGIIAWLARFDSAAATTLCEESRMLFQQLGNLVTVTKHRIRPIARGCLDTDTDTRCEL